MKIEQFWSQDRIKKIASWNRNNSYKPGTMAYRVLKFMVLMNREVMYSEIIQNEAFNFERNLMVVRSHIKGNKVGKESLKKRLKMSPQDYADNGFGWDFKSYDEFLEYNKKCDSDYDNRLKELQGIFDNAIKTRKPFMYQLPGEPNYGQMISTMLLEGTIEKVKRGIYKITDSGIEIYNKKKEGERK